MAKKFKVNIDHKHCEVVSKSFEVHEMKKMLDDIRKCMCGEIYYVEFIDDGGDLSIVPEKIIRSAYVYVEEIDE